MSVKKNTLPQVTSRWVTKTLLQAQGYHQGPHVYGYQKRHLRKRLHHQERTSSRKPPHSRATLSTPQFSNSNSYQWRPIIKKWMEQSPEVTNEAKKPLQIRINKKPTNKPRPSVTEKGKWVPKFTMMVEKCSLVEDHASTSRHHHGYRHNRQNQLWSHSSNKCASTIAKVYFEFGLTIKERAFKLQSQLFGMSSIRHSFFSNNDFTSQVKSLQCTLSA